MEVCEIKKSLATMGAEAQKAFIDFLVDEELFTNIETARATLRNYALSNTRRNSSTFLKRQAISDCFFKFVGQIVRDGEAKQEQRIIKKYNAKLERCWDESM